MTGLKPSFLTDGQGGHPIADAHMSAAHFSVEAVVQAADDLKDVLLAEHH